MVPRHQVDPTAVAVGLLDLPDRNLPPWESLPVLNLTGEMTTLDNMAAKGLARREEITGCSGPTNSTAHDVQDLLCISMSSRRTPG